MESNRRFISSRPIVGLFVLLFVALLTAWSYLVKIDRNSYFPIGILSLLPAILWSWFEIVRLKGEITIWRVAVYLFFNSFLTLIPSICVLFLAKDLDGLNKGIWVKGILFSFLCFVGIWVFNSVQEPSLKGQNMGVWFQSKSFVCLTLFSFAFWNSLFFMTMFLHWYWIIGSFGMVMFNDSAAFVLGKLVGRKSLSIYSKSKTREGVIYSLPLVASCACLILVFYKETIMDVMFGEKNNENWPWFVLFVVLSLIMCNLGDLYFSLHKRMFGIKDYSKILGSHGGFWDRFDSHCFFLGFVFISSIIWVAIP